MHLLRTFALFTGVMLLHGVANGALIDNLIDLGDVTRDNEIQMDWLDLTLTTGLSFEEVRADVGGFISAGWRHATLPEVCSLILPGPVSCANDLTLSWTMEVGFTPLVELLGMTNAPAIVSVGFFEGVDDGGMTVLAMAGISRSSVTGQSRLFVRNDDGFFVPTPARGHFLVRPIPEPSTAFLVALGLKAFGMRRRRLRFRP